MRVGRLLRDRVVCGGRRVGRRLPGTGASFLGARRTMLAPALRPHLTGIGFSEILQGAGSELPSGRRPTRLPSWGLDRSGVQSSRGTAISDGSRGLGLPFLVFFVSR